ncbi:MAG: DUF11 domain-containing protein, partial [Anaerolineae bacterium]|nr:DUF11 domain-containing protein [Anaerolineae bacterium]
MKRSMLAVALLLVLLIVAACPSLSPQNSAHARQTYNFSVNKDVSEGNPHYGQRITFTITVNNDGDTPLPGVTVSDSLADAFEVDAGSITGGGSYDPSTHEITWNLGTVKQQQTVLTFDATVKEGAIRYTNNRAIMQVYDPDTMTMPEQVDDEVNLTIDPHANGTDLKAEVVIVNPQAEYNVGDTITVQVPITAFSPAEDVTINTTLDTSLEVVPGSTQVKPCEIDGVALAPEAATCSQDAGANTVNCHAGALNHGLIVEFQVTVTRPTGGSASIEATVSSATPENAPDNNRDRATITVRRPPVDFVFVKTASKANVGVGDT